MIWCNGVLRPHGETRIAPDDRGFTLGDGLFETIRVHAGAVLHVARHLARLRDGAGRLGIPIMRDDASIGAALTATASANALQQGSLRLTVSRGPAARGLASPQDPRPTMLISAGGLSDLSPVRAIIADSTRRNEFSLLSRIKSLNYLDGVLARREAEAAGAAEAILLNTGGWVAEATAANLVVMLDGELLTPPVDHGALPGIARGLLIARGVVTEAPITPEALHDAGAILTCSSLGVRLITTLDGRAVPPRPDLATSLGATLLRP